MLLRRYGTNLQAVQPNFESKAITEIAFQRTGEFSLPASEFEEEYERVRGVELVADAEGDVKDEVEQAMLDALEEKLNGVLAELGEGELLLVESQPGRDYPKTRDRTTTQVVEGRNRLYFEYTMDPPLRLGIYRRQPG